MNKIYLKQIRASYTRQTIRIYQAYSNNIAYSILKNNSFLNSSFKLDRMTWIKPSFLWMMYRSAWATKKEQERVLAIDITREGFEWALEHSLLSHYNPDLYNYKDWKIKKNKIPVRVQWDPERDIYLNKLNYKSIQIGLSKEAVEKYINYWIINIEDITNLVHEISTMINNNIDKSIIFKRLPLEKEYLLNNRQKKILGM